MAQPKKKIAHPNLPEVSVSGRKPTRPQEMAIRDEISGGVRPFAVLGANREPLRDENGELCVRHMQTTSTLDVLMARPKKCLFAWEGITDDDGRPLEFDARLISVLWEERYDCTFPHCYVCDDGDPEAPQHKDNKHEKAHVYQDSVAYGAYVNDMLADPATFADPTTNVPA